MSAANRQEYATIVADPPWEQPSGGRHNGSDGRMMRTPPSRLPYQTLNVLNLCDLPVETWAARNAHLYLWVTNAHIEDGYHVARAWGFSPSVLLTWAKPAAGLALGGTFTQTSEHVIFARRGSLPALQRIDRTVFQWPRGQHSAKPEAFLDLIESVSPAPRLELFARRQRLGWDTWGNEALEHVEIAS